MNTKLTVRDIVRYHVLGCSNQIHKLKNNAMLVKGEGQTESMVGRPMSPTSPNWDVYQGLKRECSMWLTAIKILKTDPDFHGRPMERSTAQDHASQICHLTRAQRRTSKTTNRCLAQIKKRLQRIQEQIINGSRHTTTRSVYVAAKAPGAAAIFKQEHSITYEPKSFEAVEIFWENFRAQREADIKAKAQEVQVNA